MLLSKENMQSITSFTYMELIFYYCFFLFCFFCCSRLLCVYCPEQERDITDLEVSHIVLTVFLFSFKLTQVSRNAFF